MPPRLMEYCRQNGRMMGLEAEGEDFTPSTGDGDSSGHQQEVLCTPPQNPRELMLCTPPQRNRDDEQQQQVIDCKSRYSLWLGLSEIG